MKYDKNWVSEEHKKRNWMSKNSLYREETEHASCGVGLVVSLDGQPSRKVVENGIEALKAVWHRGAVDADGKNWRWCRNPYSNTCAVLLRSNQTYWTRTAIGRVDSGWSGFFAP